MTHARWIRIALGYLALSSLQIGVWALLAPKSFYDDFPGLGRSWISVDGPYNEHFIRDFGALNLALAVVVIAAAITLSRQLILVASIATLTWGVPHVIYHLFNTDDLGGGDLVASLGGLIFFAAIPVALVVVSRKQVDPGLSGDLGPPSSLPSAARVALSL